MVSLLCLKVKILALINISVQLKLVRLISAVQQMSCS
uniref:Uncharacterized protein n=1 Tax=Rhizophora mucronata TaxID=61149 RepID=A0A2P2NTE5_RHIMU